MANKVIFLLILIIISGNIKIVNGEHIALLATVYHHIVDVFSMLKGFTDSSYSDHYYSCMNTYSILEKGCEFPCTLQCKNVFDHIDTELCKYESNMRWFANFFSFYNDILHKHLHVCKYNTSSYKLFNLFNKDKCEEQFVNFENIDVSCQDYIQHFGCKEGCPCRRLSYTTDGDFYSVLPCNQDIFEVDYDAYSIVTGSNLLVLWVVLILFTKH